MASNKQLKPQIEIDGSQIHSLDDFFDAATKSLNSLGATRRSSGDRWDVATRRVQQSADESNDNQLHLLARRMREAADGIFVDPWDVLEREIRQAADASKNGFVLVWKNHAISNQRFGYEFTVKWLSDRLSSSTDQRDIWDYEAELKHFERDEHPTVFERLIRIFRLHGPDGRWPEFQVELVLE